MASKPETIFIINIMNTIDATETIEGALLSQRSASRTAHLFATSFWLLSLVLFRQPLSGMANLSFQDERASHILLIPCISALLVFLRRDWIFRSTRYCPSIAIPLLLIAASLWYGLKTPLSVLNKTDHLAAVASLIVMVWIALFILCYGMSAFKVASFPLLFLFLMVPIPVVVGDRTVSILQKGSAETCYGLFRMIGVPFIRHGFQFSLPGVDIEVAQQCSGIHSAVSLFIAGMLLQHLLLQGTWKKIFFTLCIFPIAIFKNAVRIVTIAWLGIHVNPGFFHGQLHRQGGLPFSVLAILMLGLLLWLLRRSGTLVPAVDPGEGEHLSREAEHDSRLKRPDPDAIGA
jgi:exosortase